jgi:hypothetical protein
VDGVYPHLDRQLNKQNRQYEFLGIEISGIAFSKEPRLFCETHCLGDKNAQIPGSGDCASPAVYIQLGEDAGGVAFYRA